MQEWRIRVTALTPQKIEYLQNSLNKTGNQDVNLILSFGGCYSQIQESDLPEFSRILDRFLKRNVDRLSKMNVGVFGFSDFAYSISVAPTFINLKELVFYGVPWNTYEKAELPRPVLLPNLSKLDLDGCDDGFVDYMLNYPSFKESVTFVVVHNQTSYDGFMPDEDEQQFTIHVPHYTALKHLYVMGAYKELLNLGTLSNLESLFTSMVIEEPPMMRNLKVKTSIFNINNIL